MNAIMKKKGAQTDKPEFSASQVSPSQRRKVIFALVTLAMGALVLWCSSITLGYEAKVRGAAAQVLQVATLAEEGVATLSNGGGSLLRAAHNAGASAARATQDVLGGGAHSLLGTLNNEFGRMRDSQRDLNSAMAPQAGRIESASQFSAALGAQHQAIDGLLKRLVEQRASSKAIESLSRLLAYAEAGVTLATAARAEFDIRTVAFELQGGEHRAAWANIDRAVGPASKAAAATVITREEITAIASAAQRARSQAVQVHDAASAAKMGLFTTVLGFAVFGAGLFLLAGAATSISTDFSRRFDRSAAHFKSSEASLERIQAWFKTVLEGRGEVVQIDRSDEFAGYQRMMNEVVERLSMNRRHLAAIVEAANSSEAHSSASSETIGAAIAFIQSIGADIERLDDVVRHLDIDSRAAAFAAGSASERASESDQVIREAVSRMEAMRDGLHEASKSVKRFGERGQEFGDSVDEFAQITEQIGVLSLNASLEAERAGEGGKGFRVVANEVRALARRAGETVEKMSKLVQGAQADARFAQESVDRSSAQIVSGAHVGVVANALTSSASQALSRAQAHTRNVSSSGARIGRAGVQVKSALDGLAERFAPTAQSAESLKAQVNSIRERVEAARGLFFKAS